MSNYQFKQTLQLVKNLKTVQAQGKRDKRTSHAEFLHLAAYRLQAPYLWALLTKTSHHAQRSSEQLFEPPFHVIANMKNI